MSDSGILRQALKIEKVNKKQATHFVLCNGDKIRYLIALDGGKKRLSLNISTYSGKLGILMRLLDYVPFSVLMMSKLGYYVKVELHSTIESVRKNTGTKHWNVIVGTYDEKQKLVMQCFNPNGDAIFIKIGNQATDEEMHKEITFLREGRRYKTFDLPEMLTYCFMDKDNPFNIQVTKEFHGEKVEPILTKDIVDIYQELSSEKKVMDGITYERSHGDFTPWNLKKGASRYVLFDWEHIGFRMPGYDLMHYVMTVEIALNGRNLTEAYDNAVKEIQNIIPDFGVEQNLILAEYRKIIKELDY